MFKPGKIFSFDTEGTGLDVPHIDEPFAFSFGNTELETHYFEWLVNPFTRKAISIAKDVVYMRKLLEDPHKEKVAHNTTYDIMAMQAHNIHVSPPYHDTKLRMKRCKTNLFNYALKPLCKRWLKLDDDDEQELKDVVKTCRRITKKLGWVQGEKVECDYWMPKTLKALHPKLYAEKLPANADKLCEIYCRRDSERCMFLYMFISEIIGPAEQLGYEREMALMPIVVKMLSQGWQVHPDKIKETRDHLTSDVKRYQKELNKWADVPLSKFTNATLAGLLFDDLGLDNGDSRSVDRAHLEELNHPLANVILDMRDANGCITKFLNPFEKFSVRRGKELVMFPQFDQGGAKTFRFSAKRPPIQTIPDAGKSKSNMSARQCIGPRDGYVWYMIDYSSLQVRIFADMAQDETMLNALATGVKPHAAAARMAWNGNGNKSGLRIMCNSVSLELNSSSVVSWCDDNNMMAWYENEEWDKVSQALLEESDWDIINAEKLINTKSAYAQAKTTFFAKLFGGGKKTIAKGLKCSLKEAAIVLSEYGKAMPSIVRFSNKCSQFAINNGYIETAYGDRIHTDTGFEYRAVAYCVQGTEAALVKDRMRELDNSVLPKTPFNILGQIHDELAFVAPNKNLRSHKPILRRIKNCMEDHTGHLTIDLPCEIDLVEKYWNDRKEIIV